MTDRPCTPAPDAAPPRVRITYDIETGGQMHKRALPFGIVVLADLDANAAPGADRPPLAKRPLLEIDPTALDTALARHQPSEATRHGLAHLVAQVRRDPDMHLKVFNASPHELLADARQHGAFDQSALFRCLHEASLGTYGGTPVSLLVGDFDIGGSDDDMALLEHLAAVAAALHAPLLAAAAPALFGLDRFADLHRLKDLRRVFEGADTARWQTFRDSENAHSVTLTLPRAQLPSQAHAGAVPCNAAVVLAARIASAFAQSGWPVACGTFHDDGAMPEVDIGTDQAQALAALGFAPLCNCPGTSAAGFPNLQTTALPRRYLNDDAHRNAQVAATLPYLLAASRFAHLIQVLLRQKIGGFLTRGNVEAWLNTRLSEYVLLDDVAPPAVLAAYPLRAASVVVTDVPGTPGAYRATLFLRPHYQLEPLTTALRLVVDLPR